jgi:hypothetical protein
MMQPLQVWLPFLRNRLSTAQEKRDCQRALEAWNGEVTVWLLPYADKIVRWQEAPGRRAVAVPSERLERIDICHVGESGYVFGRASDSRFPNSRVGGLLAKWLNYEELGPVEMYSPPKTIKFEIPRLSANAVTYQEIELETQPFGVAPIVSTEETTRTVQLRWPPESVSFRTVSPGAESEEMFGPFRRADSKGLPYGISVRDGSRILFWFGRWPEPLRPLILGADGVEALFEQDKMAEIARRSSQNLADARIRAQEAASTYLFDGHTKRQWAWFWPTVRGDGEEALLFKAEDLGFAHGDMRETGYALDSGSPKILWLPADRASH